MAFDITKKRAAETADIPVKNGDGSLMLDDDGNKITVTLCSPGSQAWMQAEAETNRKRAERLQKGGRISAALEDSKQDQIDFLCRVTVKFNGDIEHPEAKNKADLPRAIYSDDSLAFIREEIHGQAHDWGNFTKG